MSFGSIHGPEDPEDYCFEVDLSEGQELRQIDDQHAEVSYLDGHRAFGIEVEPAHDAIGTAVPTTLLVAQPNIITLTVHHRAGNPSTGGTPFDYPVVSGPGWEGGLQVDEVKGPPDEAELKAMAPTPAPAEEPPPRCDVPALQGRTLKAARRALERADCRLGPVRGGHRRGARVVKQYRRHGAVLPAGARVGVKLAA
ncbi:MAG TPA: hypothetical protein VFK14_00315 [Solirubrobacterales bacterium]|nr:hypothetical protein [Solirubrobacterales bacterium]